MTLADGANVRPSKIVTDQVTESFKKNIVNMARSWPIYFSRLYSVSVRSFTPKNSGYVGAHVQWLGCKIWGLETRTIWGSLSLDQAPN